MNVYDFDGTIYDGDSSLDFYFFCLKRYKLYKTLPSVLWNLALMGLHIREKTPAKQGVYSYYKYIPNIDDALEQFWKKNSGKLKEWYIKGKMRDDDVIISASPEFQLRPICDRYGIKLIASRVDKYTGGYTGLNCDGKEKVRRFYEAFPGGRIDSFYSDSKKDTPLARLADSAYSVKGDRITAWPQ